MAKAKKTDNKLVVQEADVARIKVTVIGDAPLQVHKFSTKSKKAIENKHREGESAGAKRDRSARDFEQEGKDAAYYCSKGVYGFHAGAFRAAMVDAARISGLVMTKVKASGLRIIADGADVEDGTPLVKIRADKPFFPIEPVRLDDGSVSLVCRPTWHPGWEIDLTVQFLPDVIDASSVVNLLARAGMAIGVGEGRPYSKNSVGRGYGTFTVKPGKTKLESRGDE